MSWIPTFFIGLAAAAVAVSYLIEPMRPPTESTENLRERSN